MLNMPDDKRGAVMAAAFDVFMNYGFRKTSMDDIARAAGMSRPAVYQVFRNKTEIFRALSETVMEHASTQARLVLNDEGRPFAERLFGAIDSSILELHRKIEATAHGAELLGVNDEVASDLEDKWCETLTAVFSEGLTGAADRGEISLSGFGVDAHGVARILVQALEGMKFAYMRGNPMEQDVRRLVTFLADAVATSETTRQPLSERA